MTDYVKSTNFASKDSLASGNPLKIVKGLEIDIEFNNIAAAIATKSNGIDTALTGTPTAPTAASGTNTSQIATTAFVRTAIMDSVYPVGSVYISAGSATNPATLLGFGTWAAFGAGRVMVGLNGGDALFDSLEETGGSKDAVVVSHSHTASSSSTFSGNALGTHAHTVTIPGGYSEFGGLANPGTSASASVSSSAVSAGTPTGSVSTSTSISTTGSSGTNANLQPYITVAMWKRTA
jgi:hypothetical protein